MLYFIIVFVFTIKILTGRCKYILYKYYLIQIVSSRECIVVCKYIQLKTILKLPLLLKMNNNKQIKLNTIL